LAYNCAQEATVIRDALLIIISFTLGVFVMAFVYASVITHKPQRAVKHWADCGEHYTPKHRR
jgi:hypothetical protein